MIFGEDFVGRQMMNFFDTPAPTMVAGMPAGLRAAETTTFVSSTALMASTSTGKSLTDSAHFPVDFNVGHLVEASLLRGTL